MTLSCAEQRGDAISKISDAVNMQQVSDNLAKIMAVPPIHNARGV